MRVHHFLFLPAVCVLLGPFSFRFVYSYSKYSLYYVLLCTHFNIHHLRC